MLTGGDLQGAARQESYMYGLSLRIQVAMCMGVWGTLVRFLDPSPCHKGVRVISLGRPREHHDSGGPMHATQHSIPGGGGVRPGLPRFAQRGCVAAEIWQLSGEE